jgi:hypothetical protein
MLQCPQTNLACFGPHDSHRVWEAEVPILADPKNDLLLSYSAPSMKECRRSNILRAQSLSSYTAQLIGYPKLPVLHQLQFSVELTMTWLLDHTSPLLEYVSSRWHGRYKRKLPCTTCTTCFTSAIPGLSDNITCSPFTRKCNQHCLCRANMFVVIPPLMIVRQPDQCQGQHTKKENPRWPIMVPPSISSSNFSTAEIN